MRHARRLALRIIGAATAAIAFVAVAAAPALAQTLERTHVAGVEDAFAPPKEPVLLGGGCTSRFPGAAWTGFDDPRVDRHFCHTFADLPKNISCAGTNTLKIHLKANSTSGTTNDSLNLYFGASSPFWGQTIETLNGTWDAGDEATLTLDLCNLEPGVGASVSNAATEIDMASVLDVYVQDDTQVDFMELTLTANAIELVYGEMDAYVLPGDPTFRGSGFPATTYRDFDATSSNVWFGQTLGSPPGTSGPGTSGTLPLYIVGAEFEIAMKPQGSDACNDTLNFFAGAPASGTPSWVRGIGDRSAGSCGQAAILDLTNLLPPSFAVPPIPNEWISPFGGTVLTMDLDDLPPSEGSGTFSLVQAMSEARRLDVLIQDDTNVDYIKLRVLCSRHKPAFAVASLHQTPALSGWGMTLLVLTLLAGGAALIGVRQSRQKREPGMG